MDDRKQPAGHDDQQPQAIQPTRRLYELTARLIVDRWPAWADAHPRLAQVIDRSEMHENITHAIARRIAADPQAYADWLRKKPEKSATIHRIAEDLITRTMPLPSEQQKQREQGPTLEDVQAARDEIDRRDDIVTPGLGATHDRNAQMLTDSGERCDQAAAAGHPTA